MKIVVTGSQFPDSFTRNIFVTLESMGHEVTAVATSHSYHHQNRIQRVFWAYASLAFPRIERAAFVNLIRTVAEIQPDMVLLTYGLPPEILRQLREVSGAKIACWFTDAISNFNRGYLVAGSYDALFIKEPYLIPLLRDKLELNAFYLPEACNPQWHKPTVLTEEDRREYGTELAAIGTFHYYRARMLEPFTGYGLKIWGASCPPWIDSPARASYQNQFVGEHTKAKALRAAKIVINTMYYTEIDGLNCSLFEIAGCGAFQIADWKPSLPELFEPEREIVTFRSRAELREKVEYYLQKPEERSAIAERACRRAHRDHTYQKRLETILTMVLPGQMDAPSETILAYRSMPTRESDSKD